MKRMGWWDNLERWVAPATVLAEWREVLDGEFALAKGFLRGTDEKAEEYPCRKQPPCGCEHEVIHHSIERIVAACRCEERECGTFALRREEVLIHGLDWWKLGAAIRTACGFDTPPEKDAGVIGEPGTRMVGTYGDLGSPAYLVIRQKEPEFLAEMERLINQGQGEPFMVLAPTDRHLTKTVRALLQRHRCAFIPLARHLAWDGAGKFKAAKTLRVVLERFVEGLRGGSDAGEPVVLKSSARYVLRKGAGVWRLVFDGKEAEIKDGRGIALVAHLLFNPSPGGLHGTRLAGCVFGHAVVEAAKMMNEGDSTRAMIQEQAKEWAAVLNNPASSPMDLAEAKEKLEVLAEALNVTGGSGDESVEKQVKAVRRAIHRCIEQLQKARDRSRSPHPVLRAFGEHLHRHLWIPSSRFSGTRHGRTRTETAGRITYEPPKGVVWKE